MEHKKIKFGVSSHFQRDQWEIDMEYLKTSLRIAKDDLEKHSQTVSTAFQHEIAFLTSIHLQDKSDCEMMYESLLKNDPNNLNALAGLYEVTVSTGRKNECLRRFQDIITSEYLNEALPKALLEIGLILSLLIPKFKSEDSKRIPDPDTRFPSETANLTFRAEEIPMESDLLTDCNIAQKKRVYSSVHYFKEGISRYGQLRDNKKDMLIWKFFEAQAYNRLDYWIAKTRGSQQKRQDFCYKSLDSFCELVTEFDPQGGNHEKLYFQRSLAYIGHILTSRKDILLHGKPCNFVPDCFQRIPGHFLRTIWDTPMDAFRRAKEFGFDNVVYTRLAKVYLCEKDYDTCIDLINEVFESHDGIHWYAASIRMRAFKKKYGQCFEYAKSSRDFSNLPREFLMKAEEDGKYCHDTNPSVDDLFIYATVLRWLGTSPDGKQVTQKERIYKALQVLDRLYKEQGCHTHFKVHKVRAECHADLEELDDAIKYMTWSLNTNIMSKDNHRPPISFDLLIEYLLKKLTQTDEVEEIINKQHIKGQMKYRIEEEISRCHDDIRAAEGFLTCELFDILKNLLTEYDKKLLDQADHLLASKALSDMKQKMVVKELKTRYGSIFYLLNKCCKKYPDQIKHLLDFTLKQTFSKATSTLVDMCLKCLGGKHKEWTQVFNRKLRNRQKGQSMVEMFVPPPEPLENGMQYDYVVIHAPEDKEWIFFKFLPEMEDRPKRFKGCVPDRNFRRDRTFDENIKNFMERTTKVILVVSSSFFGRLYELLQQKKIIDKLKELHTRKRIDVIAMFIDSFSLDEDTHRQWFQFWNVDASGYYFDWNYLRILLLKQLPANNTQRTPVIWEDAVDADQVRPTGTVSRKSDKKQLHKLHSDQSIPQQARSAVKDYALADITKGHMTPLADHSTDMISARETNFMTNIYPEIKNNFLWNRLEEYCRDKLKNDFETINVISGTLFRPQEECESANTEAVSSAAATTLYNRTTPKPHIEECTEDLSRLQINESSNQRQSLESPKKSRRAKTVTYEVVGGNGVAVPTHLFKVIIGENPDAEPCVGAFMVPNVPLYDADLDQLSVSISQLEQWLGISLCRNLGTELKKKQTSSLPHTFFSKHYRIRKMLRYVTSLEDLSQVWRNMPGDLRADHDLINVYEEKKSRLEKQPTKQN